MVLVITSYSIHYTKLYDSVANISRTLKTTYELPNIGRYGRTLEAEVGARQLETDAYDLTGLKTGATLV